MVTVDFPFPRKTVRERDSHDKYLSLPEGGAKVKVRRANQGTLSQSQHASDLSILELPPLGIG